MWTTKSILLSGSILASASVSAQFADIHPGYAPNGLILSLPDPGREEGTYGSCIDGEGRILQFGNTADMNIPDVGYAAILRWSADGVADAEFGTNGRMEIPGYLVYSGMSFPSGEVIAFSINLDDLGPAKLIRLTPSGALDTTFGNNGFLPAPFTVPQNWAPMLATQDGRVAFAFATDNTGYIAMVNADGSLDASFGTNGLFSTPVGTSCQVMRLVQDNEGNYLLGGTFWTSERPIQPGVMRISPTGQVDQSFGINGITPPGILGTLTGRAVSSIVVEPNGNIVIGGLRRLSSLGTVFGLARLLPNGQLDPATPNNGQALTTFSNDTRRLHVYDLARDPVGRILAFGQLRSDQSHQNKQPAWACFKEDLTIDPSFGNAGLMPLTGAIYMHHEGQIHRLPNGDIVSSTYYSRAGGQAVTGISRLDLSLPTDVENPATDEPLLLHPNPASYVVNVGIPHDANGMVEHTLLDLTGRPVWTMAPRNVSAHETLVLELPTTLTSGVYILVQRGARYERTARLVVEH